MRTKKIAVLSLFVSIGIVLQMAEHFIFPPMPIPGGKLGLSNVITIINISLFGGVNALCVAIIRSILGSLMYGGFSALVYSLSGSVASVLVMWMLSRCKSFSGIGIGALGGAVHNMAQVIVAAVIFSNIFILTYMPILVIIGTIAGVFTGLCASAVCQTEIIKRVGFSAHDD